MQSPGHTTFKLDNGIKVHYSPFFCPDVFFHWNLGYGAVNEPPEWDGLSHFSEHLLFVNSSPSEESIWDRYGFLTGHTPRAMTGLDMVSDRSRMPVESFPQFCSLFSHLIKNREFDKKLFDHEKESVVLSEAHLHDQSKQEQIGWEVRSILFPDHPYGSRNAIGSWETIKTFTPEIVSSYRDQVYVAENMQLVVVGGLGLEAVESELNKSFGDIIRGHPTDPISPPAPTNGGELTFTLGLPNSVTCHYRLPGITSQDNIATSVIKEYIGGGSNSLLFKKLREELGIYSSGMDTSYHVLAGLIVCSASGINEGTHDEILGVIKGEIDKVVNEGIPHKYLEQFKRKVEITYYRHNLEGLFDRGGLLSDALVNNRKYLLNKIELLDALTNEEIMRVADSIFSQPSVDLKIIYKE